MERYAADIPPCGEDLAASQELRSHQKISVGRTITDSRTCCGGEMHGLLRWAPCPRAATISRQSGTAGINRQKQSHGASMRTQIPFASRCRAGTPRSWDYQDNKGNQRFRTGDYTRTFARGRESRLGSLWSTIITYSRLWTTPLPPARIGGDDHSCFRRMPGDDAISALAPPPRGACLSPVDTLG
jgi:hypothetical protein